MSKLFVCEKPHQASLYQFLLEENDAIILAPCVVGYRFLFDKNLEFKNLPYIDKEPKYKKNILQYDSNINNQWIENYKTQVLNYKERFTSEIYKNFYFYKQNEPNSENYKNALKDIHNYLSSFDEIIFACDVDHTGVRGFDFLFKLYYEIENLQDFCNNNDIKLSSIKAWSLDQKSLEKTFLNRNSFYESDLFNKKRLSYMNKDYFEYNYLLNSLLLINKAYYLTFNKYPDNIITKNFIQILFKFENNEKIEMIKLLRNMENSDIGNAASRNEILNRMSELKLIQSNNKHEVSITYEGKVFLSFLHRKMNDPHLAERLEKDYELLSHIEFKNKYNKYLKTVFEKQKRFINSKT